MSETIVPAPPNQRIWVLNGRQFTMRTFDQIDVIAWAVPASGHPIPITVAGRLERNTDFMLASESGWIALPSGVMFDSSTEALMWLEAEARRRVAA